MGMGRKNHVNINPIAYNVMLLGEPKIGKTTVMKETLDKLVGENGYFFAELGREKGAAAIEGIKCINCIDWDSEYDENTNEGGWETFVDDIVENKNTDPDYKNLKVIVVDTYDQYITLAEDEALSKWNKETPEKRVSTLNGAWGGFGAGGRKAIELMFEQIDRLERVGIKVWWIGHVKNKSVTDVATGDTYDVLTSDQQQNYFNALKKNLHFLGLAYIDRNIVKEKTGRKNIVTKKEETKSIVKDEYRKIKFRDDTYCVDSGSRFKDIVNEVDLDAQQFIDAMVNAIKAEQSKSGKSFEETKAEQEQAEIERLKVLAEKSAKEKEKNKNFEELEEYRIRIVTFVRQNKADIEYLKPLLIKSRELGYTKPMDVDTIENAKILMDVIDVITRADDAEEDYD